MLMRINYEKTPMAHKELGSVNKKQSMLHILDSSNWAVVLCKGRLVELLTFLLSSFSTQYILHIRSVKNI